MTKIKRIMASKVLPKDKIYLFGKWRKVIFVDAYDNYTELDFGTEDYLHLNNKTVIRVQREEVK